MSDARKLAIFGFTSIFEAHKKSRQARELLAAQLQQKMSDYSNDMIWEDKKKFIPKKVDESDPEDIKFIKNSLWALYNAEVFLRVLRELIQSKGWTGNIATLVGKRNELWSSYGLVANLHYLNQSRKVGGFLYPAIEVLRIKLEDSKTALLQMDTIVEEVKKQLNEFLDIRPAPPKEPHKGKKDKEKKDTIEEIEREYLLTPIRVVMKLVDSNYPELGLRNYNFDRKGYYVINENDHDESAIAKSLKAIFNIMWGLNRVMMRYQEKKNTASHFIAIYNSLRIYENLIQVAKREVPNVADEIMQELKKMLEVNGAQIFNNIDSYASTIQKFELDNHLKPGAVLADLREIYTRLELVFIDNNLHLPNPFISHNRVKEVTHRLANENDDTHKNEIIALKTVSDSLADNLHAVIQYEDLALSPLEQVAWSQAVDRGVVLPQMLLSLSSLREYGVLKNYKGKIRKLDERINSLQKKLEDIEKQIKEKNKERIDINVSLKIGKTTNRTEREIELATEKIEDTLWALNQYKALYQSSTKKLHRKKKALKTTIASFEKVEDEFIKALSKADKEKLKANIANSHFAILEQKLTYAISEDTPRVESKSTLLRWVPWPFVGITGEKALPVVDMTRVLAFSEEISSQIDRDLAGIERMREELKQAKVILDLQAQNEKILAAKNLVKKHSLISLIKDARAFAEQPTHALGRKSRLAAIKAYLWDMPMQAVIEDAHHVAVQFANDPEALKELIIKLYAGADNDETRFLAKEWACQLAMIGYVERDKWDKKYYEIMKFETTNDSKNNQFQQQIIINTLKQIPVKDFIEIIQRAFTKDNQALASLAVFEFLIQGFPIDDQLIEARIINQIDTNNVREKDFKKKILELLKDLHNKSTDNPILQEEIGKFIARLALHDKTFAQLAFPKNLRGAYESIIEQGCLPVEKSESKATGKKRYSEPELSTYYEGQINALEFMFDTRDKDYEKLLAENVEQIWKMHTLLYPEDERDGFAIVTGYKDDPWTLMAMLEEFVRSKLSKNSAAEHIVSKLYSAFTLAEGEESQAIRENIFYQYLHDFNAANSKYIRLLPPEDSHLFWEKIKAEMLINARKKINQEFAEIDAIVSKLKSDDSDIKIAAEKFKNLKQNEMGKILDNLKFKKEIIRPVFRRERIKKLPHHVSAAQMQLNNIHAEVMIEAKHIKIEIQMRDILRKIDSSGIDKELKAALILEVKALTAATEDRFKEINSSSANADLKIKALDEMIASNANVGLLYEGILIEHGERKPELQDLSIKLKEIDAAMDGYLRKRGSGSSTIFYVFNKLRQDKLALVKGFKDEVKAIQTKWQAEADDSPVHAEEFAKRLDEIKNLLAGFNSAHAQILDKHKKKNSGKLGKVLSMLDESINSSPADASELGSRGQPRKK